MIARKMAVLGLLLLSTTVLHATTMYVDDTLYLGFYNSPDGVGKQFTSAPSGTKLTLIESRDSYSLVRTEKGTEGWVKSKYLVADPPAVVRIKSMEQAAERAAALTLEVETLSDENAYLRKEIDSMLMAQSFAEEPEPEIDPDLEVTAEPEVEQDPVDQQQLAMLRAAIDDAMRALQNVSVTEPTIDPPELSASDFLFDDSGEDTAPTMAWDNILSILRSMNFLHYSMLGAAVVIGFLLGIFVLDRRIRRQHGGYRIW